MSERGLPGRGGADQRSGAPISPRSAREALQPETAPPPPPRSHAVRHPLVVFLNFVLTVAVIAVVLVGGAALYAKLQFDRTGPLEAPVTLQVASGAGVAGIADQLQRMGAITNRWVFRVGVQFYDRSASLKAGEYLIPANASMREIMEKLAAGQAIVYAITIPEGLTSEQIVERIRANDILTGDIAAVPPEGSLLPDTYQFDRGYTRQNLINRMRRERDRVLTEIWGRRIPGLPVTTPEEMVALASIVEKETGIADERTRVAAVFINRLNQNMKLQSDPTILYGLFGGAGRPAGYGITRADMERPTPYNTYTIEGLPPGPIANPGRASLEAVANPSRTADLYFVADGTGGHAFAETYDEHLRNVARWRLIEEQRARAAAAPAAPAVPEPQAAAGVADVPAPTPGAAAP